MSYLCETPEPDERHPAFDLCLQERDRTVYEIRRFLKTAGVKYKFLHDSPVAGCGLVLRGDIPKGWPDFLKGLAFTQTSGVHHKDVYRLRQDAAESLIRIIVRTILDDTRPHVSGPLLLITTHTLD